MMTLRPTPRLMLVTDAARARLPLLDLAEAAVAGGVDAIYLRDMEVSQPDRSSLLFSLRERVGDAVALLIYGDPATARELGAGLHLRERDPLPIGDRECTAYGGRLLGRSVHSSESAAASLGMDYLLAGHVYPSASKPGLQPLGLDGLRAIVRVATCPVLAIGGITPERVADVVRAGARGVAVIGAIAAADDPGAAAAVLRAALDLALNEQKEHAVMFEKNIVMDEATIDIQVNGKSVVVSSGATIHDFLASKRMTGAMAIVERNGQIVPRGEYGATLLTPGDRLEVVHAVGGG